MPTKNGPESQHNHSQVNGLISRYFVIMNGNLLNPGLILGLGLLAGGVQLPDASAGDQTPATESKTLPKAAKWAFVLQSDKLSSSADVAAARLAASDRDVIVMDFSFDGSLANKWSPRQIQEIRSGSKSGPRKVLAYLSIGEAEDYRHYWQEDWDPEHDGTTDAGAPLFLLSENPHWSGNYKVRFWHPEWQSLVLKYLDIIQNQGFDGIYLDIVDGFEFFEKDPDSDTFHDNKTNPETGNSYRRDMIQWVSRLASIARQKKPGFLIVPQNGFQLLEHPEYRKVISGIGIEDLYTDGHQLQSQDSIRYKMHFLSQATADDIPVFVIDYSGDFLQQARSIQKARKLPASILFTDRPLTTLGRAFAFP